MRNIANKPNGMIDLNVILDVLQKRDLFYEESASLLAAAETDQIQGYMAAHSVTTLLYPIQKAKSPSVARTTITNLFQFLKIGLVDQTTIEQALNLDCRDFEDAVQMMSAIQCKADFLVTRNIKDYQPAFLTVIQPVDFVGTL
jgi:predicted nucleic acid-binding protein